MDETIETMMNETIGKAMDGPISYVMDWQKVVVVGSSKVGKTSMLMRWRVIISDFILNYMSDIGWQYFVMVG